MDEWVEILRLHNLTRNLLLQNIRHVPLRIDPQEFTDKADKFLNILEGM